MPPVITAIVEVTFWVAKAYSTAIALGGAGAFAVRLGTVALLSSLSSKLFGPKVQGVGLSPMDVMSRSSLEHRKIVYGQAIVSGPVYYNNLSGTNNEYLWYGVALCDGLSEDLVEVHFDSDVITKAQIDWVAGTTSSDGTGTGDVSTSTFVGDNSTAGAQIYYYLGDDAQPVCGVLDTAFGAITTNHRLRGVTHIVCKLLYDEDTEEVWKSGPPNDIKVVLKGRLVYDPRLDTTQAINKTTSPYTYGSGAHRTTDATTWAWSENPSLCVADYLTQVMGVATTAIDWPSVANAADDCEVLVVTTPAASPENTEARFTCNGALSLGSSHKDNLDSILSSMAGKLSYSGGVWKVRASVWETSSVTITEDDLAGDLDVRGSAPRSERFNGVRGFFVDPTRNYEASEFPHVSEATYVTRDNGETITYDLQLPMTNSATEAQRIAYRNLAQGNNQIVAKLKLNAKGSKIAVGDIVTADLSELGWTDGGNALLYSNDPSQWTLTKCTQATSGDWFAISEDGTSGSHNFLLSLAFPSDDTDYVFSIDLKAEARTWVFMFVLNQPGTQPYSAYFDIYNGVIGATIIGNCQPSMQSIPGGGYRCSIRCNSGSTGSNELAQVIIAEADGDTIFTGLSQVSIYARRASMQKGTYPGLYHETTSVAVTTTAKTFRCIEWARNPDSTFDVTLKEDDSTDYTDPLVTAYGTAGTGGVTIPADIVKPPTGLTATAGVGGIRLDWTNPPALSYDYIDIYEDTNDSWAGSGLIASVRANTFFVSRAAGTTYYYWVRAVKTPDLESLRNPDSDTTTISAAATGGSDGYNAATLTAYKRSAADPGDDPGASITYTFATAGWTPGNGWSKTIPSVGSPTLPVWAVSATAYSQSTTDNVLSADWSAPTLILQDGSDGSGGAAGLNVATVYIYQRTLTDSAPASNPADGSEYTFATGGLTFTTANGWTATIPTQTSPEGPFLWATLATASSTGVTDTILNSEWQSPQKLAEDGTDGAAGTDGTSPVVSQLTNSAVVVSADYDGTNYSLTGAGGTHQVLEGDTDVTTSSTHIVVGETGSPLGVTQNGLTMSVGGATGVYTLTGAGDSWTSDEESFTMRATYGGNNYDKVYTIAKSKQAQVVRINAVGKNLNAEDISTDDTATGFKVDNNGYIYSYAENGAGPLSKTYVIGAQWLGSGVVGDYEVILEKISSAGGDPAGSALDTWLGCGTDRAWTCEITTVGTQTFAGTLRWRDATTLEILGQASLDMNCNVEV